MSFFALSLNRYLKEFSTITIYSEVTAQCNNKCIFCPIDKLNRTGFINEKVIRKVKEFLLSFPKIKFKIFFHVLGEPLIYKDLENYISSISGINNVEIWIATNGVLLTPERLISLQKAGLKNIWYSMFYTNESDYKKNTQTENFTKAKENLINLLKNHKLFDHIHIVTFSDCANEFNDYIEGENNISIELKRRIKEWRFDKIYSFITKMFFSAFSKLDPRKYICISINGELAYDWRDYNFLSSKNNICEIENIEILKGYKKSSLLNRFKKLLLT